MVLPPLSITIISLTDGRFRLRGKNDFGGQEAAAAISQSYAAHCADVSVDHIKLGVLSRGEIVNG